MTARVRTTGRIVDERQREQPTAKRSSPYEPSLASSADSSIEPAVGASAYVIGDHVCSGQIGAFTAKAMAKAMNSHTAVRGDIDVADSARRRR